MQTRWCKSFDLWHDVITYHNIKESEKDYKSKLENEPLRNTVLKEGDKGLDGKYTFVEGIY
jgi:hypothetical protein